MKISNITIPKIYHKIFFAANFFLIFSLFQLSCEKDVSQIIDLSIGAPFIFDAKLNSDFINADTIKISPNPHYLDTITIYNRIQVKVVDPDGLTDILKVTYNIYKPNSNEVLIWGKLNDEGKNGDLSSNDGTFSSNFSFRIVRQYIGIFRIELQAKDKSNLTSNLISRKINVYSKLYPPYIYNLKAPDTVALPLSGVKIIQMSIAAFDSNGRADIYEVFFRSLDSSDPSKKFFMLDNGNIKTHGDSLTNDGIFSIKIELPFNMTPKPYRFEFTARDNSGLKSNKILHTLTVVKP